MSSKNFLFTLFFLLITGTLFGQSDIWVGSWSCAPYAAGASNTPPAPYLANNTLRQVVRVSISGDTVRVKFSNKTGTSPVTMNSVNIAVSMGGSSVDAATITPLKFNGSRSVTMNSNTTVMSDPVAFKLKPSMRVAITIYYGQVETNANITSHVGSRTDSYILTGDQSNSAGFGGAVVTPHWYHINTIDVLAPDTAGCVAVIGNSITDGYGLSGGLHNRWTDVFSQRLLDDNRTKNIGVLNLGIGGTNIISSGLNRYKDDILSQSGLRWVIVFYGTNDIGGGSSAANIIAAMQKMINDAHAINVKVYGATITPFKGNGYYTEPHEQVRNAVNEWIRTPGNFDACIDFDKAIRDPNDISKMLPIYSNDWLHPNVAGYEQLGKSVSLDLFTEIINNQTIFASAGEDQTTIDFGNKGSKAITLNGSGTTIFGGRTDKYIWSVDGKQIATGVTPTVNLPVGTHYITLTVSDNSGNSDTDDVVITIVKDSGVWLEAECGKVGSLWNTEADTYASNGKYITAKPGTNSNNNAWADATGLATYTFELEEGGVYNLYTRLLCPTYNDDSFWVKMDNGQYVMWNGLVTNGWQWLSFPNSFSLSKGIHTLTIGFREDGAKLDKIWITNVSATLNNDMGSDAANCSTTATNPKKKSEVEIYPNPVNEKLIVSLSDADASSAGSDVTIFDNSGTLLFEKTLYGTHSTIDMSKFKQGVYFLKINSHRESIVKKLIKR